MGLVDLIFIKNVDRMGPYTWEPIAKIVKRLFTASHKGQESLNEVGRPQMHKFGLRFLTTCHLAAISDMLLHICTFAIKLCLRLGFSRSAIAAMSDFKHTLITVIYSGRHYV